MTDRFDDFWKAIAIATGQCLNGEQQSNDNLSVKTLSKTDIETILGAKDRVTPMYISELDSNEIFVFGSDKSGIHRGRASLIAKNEFGAHRLGEGASGQAYAIPTTNRRKKIEGRTRTIEEVVGSVNKFIKHAKDHPEQTFYVTRIGAGYAGFSDQEIAPMFREALKLKNVYLPQSFLNVLFDIKPSFATPSEMVPSQPTEVKSFRQELDMQLSLYQTWLRDNYTFSKNNKNLWIIDCVERLSSGLSKAVDLMYRGLPSEAYKALQESLELKNKKGKEEILLWELQFEEVEDGNYFYRMRNEKDSWSKKQVGKKDMFHIPYSLRHIVKTQRYSVPGYPSLYLGKHVYACWEELGRPNISDCLFSILINDKPFKRVNLTIPNPSTWKVADKNKPINKELQNQIILFPLIIACTFKTKRQDAFFKPEYIVPQLLLQYVKEKAFKVNRENKKNGTKERVIYGIEYTSVNIPSVENNKNKAFEEYSEQYTNYVIPVINIKNEHCEELCNMFRISDPVCQEYELIETTGPDKTSPHTKSSLDKIEITLLGKDKTELSKINCKE